MKRPVVHIFTALCISFVVLLSCQYSSETIYSDWYSVNLDNVESKTDFPLTSLFDSVKVIALSNEDVVLGEVSKIESYGDNFVISDRYDAKGVYLFDADGNLLKRFGGVGLAPEEYYGCDDFAIDEETSTLYIYDWMGKKILAYSLETGNYIQTLNLEKDTEIDRIRIVGGKLYGILTFHSLQRHKEEDPYILKELDLKSGKVLNQWLKMSSFNKGWPGVLNETPLFYKIGDGKELFAYGISDTILCFDKGTFYPYLVMEGEKMVSVDDFNKEEKNVLQITDQRKQNQIRRSMQSRLGRDKEKILTISNIYSNGEILYFQCRAWLSHIVVYNIQQHSFEVYSSNHNDVLLKEVVNGGFLPVFRGGNENGIFYEYGSDLLHQLTFYNEKDILTDKVKNKEALKHLNEDSNPVILYYEFK
jgi:outer membrane protein assembly factor BamB